MTKPLGLFAGILILYILVSVPQGLSAQAVSEPLVLGPNDVLVEPRADGYHLYIRQIPGAASVMLTDAFEPADHKLATYALRSVGPNPVNDSEPRLLDGQFLKIPHHSLVSSTAAPYSTFGPCFQIVLPPVVEFGSQENPNSRYGKIDVQSILTSAHDPVWFSIRVFAKPFADYTGTYKENAFELKSFLIRTTRPVPPGRYKPNLQDGFSRLGNAYPAIDAADGVLRAAKAGGAAGGSVDMVICLDTTKGMEQNLVTIKANLINLLKGETVKFSSYRIGVVFYRDYLEDYLTRIYGFTSDLGQLQKTLEGAEADGGGEIPDAVVEGLWAGLNGFDWKADHRVVVCLGDAPQHPIPRGAVTEAMVRQTASEKKVELQMIMLPQPSP